ncbi:pilus assembly protein [Duganella sp. LX20W]|uniref:Pilus assembly protein n=1 Tax=Rugamonas brunnea TaxID=2758569 RepID=A0A7W2EU08_9BURK|nr:TadE family protein [Rugamonas brunnea]MBA5638613.1 pilus assembly protein [Rugamonas brunnea]
MNHRTNAKPHIERGVAAVEFAIILPIFLLMLALPLYFGRILWHYTAAQKAAYDAARYIASVPRSEMKDPNKIGKVVALAKTIVATETAELNSGSVPVGISVICDGLECLGLNVPTTVTVGVQVTVDDIFFPAITSGMAGLNSSNLLNANISYAYVGI